MSIIDLTAALRESAISEIGKLRGIATAEFKMYEELRALAATITDRADLHYARYMDAATKADHVSLKLRKEAS